MIVEQYLAEKVLISVSKLRGVEQPESGYDEPFIDDHGRAAVYDRHSLLLFGQCPSKYEANYFKSRKRGTS